MKIRTLVLATTLLTTATGLAFAQSSPAPANQSGGGISATTPAPTDPSIASESGNTTSAPARGTDARPGAAGTTGSGMATPGLNMQESNEKNASPASPDVGLKQEK